MIGAIRTRDIVSHPWVTVQCFGWRTFLRALLAEPNRTFLSLLSEDDVFSPIDAEATAILKQCIDLEMRAEKIYLALEEATVEEPRLALFFATLAEQEQEHAELLHVCLAASNRSGWRRGVLLAWRDVLDSLDQGMREAETLLYAVTDVDDAMQLVVQVELSEVNHVFLAAMAASNSPFVKKLQPFQTAVETHIGYIAAQLAELTPHLSLGSDGMKPACSCSGE
jgi:hypothetical protein